MHLVAGMSNSVLHYHGTSDFGESYLQFPLLSCFLHTGLDAFGSLLLTITLCSWGPQVHGNNHKGGSCIAIQSCQREQKPMTTLLLVLRRTFPLRLSKQSQQQKTLRMTFASNDCRGTGKDAAGCTLCMKSEGPTAEAAVRAFNCAIGSLASVTHFVH